MRTRSRLETFQSASQEVSPAFVRRSGSLWACLDGGPNPSFDAAFIRVNGSLDPVIRKNVTVNRVTSMTDNVFPEYHRYKKEGKILPTMAMTKEVIETPEEPLVATAIYGNYVINSCRRNATDGYSMSGEWAQQTVTLLSAPSLPRSNESFLNDLKIEAMAKLNSQGMDYLTTSAEGLKTLAMLTGLKRRFISMLDDLFKAAIKFIKNKKLIIRTLSDISAVFESIWLEFRFGWRILYYDMVSITNYIENMYEAEKLIVGRAKGSEVAEATQGHSTTITQTVEVTVGYAGLLDPAKLGYANPLNTAWDLVPFSLVVDWFIGIQEWILAFASSPQNVKELPASSFQTIKRKSTAVALPLGDVMHGTWHNHVTVVPGNSISLSREHITRSVPTGLKFSLPSWKGGPAGYQKLDFLALMRPLLGLLRS